MFLHDLFIQNGYKNIVECNDDRYQCLNLEYLYGDDNKKPVELLGVYISRNWDELYFVLKGDDKDINKLCKEWDEKIRIFMIFGSDDKNMIQKFKYNAIQVILCESEIQDRTQEGSLNVSRKLILPCKFNNDNHADIDDENILELPFVLISHDVPFTQVDIKKELSKLIPDIGSSMEFMMKPRRRDQNKKGFLIRTFEKEFQQIKEWLEINENTEN